MIRPCQNNQNSTEGPKIKRQRTETPENLGDYPSDFYEKLVRFIDIKCLEVQEHGSSIRHDFKIYKSALENETNDDDRVKLFSELNNRVLKFSLSLFSIKPDQIPTFVERLQGEPFKPKWQSIYKRDLEEVVAMLFRGWFALVNSEFSNTLVDRWFKTSNKITTTDERIKLYSDTSKAIAFLNRLTSMEIGIHQIPQCQNPNSWMDLYNYYLNQEIGNLGIKILNQFQKETSSLTALISWISQNTGYGSNNFTGAFPVFKDFFHAFERILKNPKVYSYMIRTLGMPFVQNNKQDLNTKMKEAVKFGEESLLNFNAQSVICLNAERKIKVNKVNLGDQDSCPVDILKIFWLSLDEASFIGLKRTCRNLYKISDLITVDYLNRNACLVRLFLSVEKLILQFNRVDKKLAENVYSLNLNNYTCKDTKTKTIGVRFLATINKEFPNLINLSLRCVNLTSLSFLVFKCLENINIHGCEKIRVSELKVPFKKGTITYPSRTIYEGEFVENVPEGKGSVRQKKKIHAVPDVEFFDDDWNQIRSKKYKCEGSFNQGKLHGFSEFSIGNMVIKGEFNMGKLPRNGSIIYGEGHQYEGELLNMQASGIGTLICANGDIFKGKFFQGLPSEGVLATLSGWRVEGPVVRCCFSKLDRETLNGTLQFENNRLEGSFTLKYDLEKGQFFLDHIGKISAIVYQFPSYSISIA